MYNVISLSLGEIVLKGKNRGYFERILLEKIKESIVEYKATIFKDQGKIFIELQNKDHIDDVINKVKNIFGIVKVSKCIKIQKDIKIIRQSTIDFFQYLLDTKNVSTFKIATNRTDKKFEINSVELNKSIGELVLNNFDNIKVDIHNPDVIIYIDIKNNCYLYDEKIKTVGGLPVGTNGKGLLLLSGGIDSPVAGYLMAKRGVSIDAIYYHTYPFTSERVNEKVKKLTQLMAKYCGEIKLYSVNILNIYKEIKNKCPESETTILARRFMMRIAEKVANDNNIDVLITGENLGQVASQTINSISVINDTVNKLILRPLIGMDKTEIIEISKEINTYETSILPYDDCCSIFAPKHPVTRPRLEAIQKYETSLNINELIENTYNNIEIENLK